jgi:hypothetical protein
VGILLVIRQAERRAEEERYAAALRAEEARKEAVRFFSHFFEI